MPQQKKTTRTLAIVLGDQLDRDSALWSGFDAARDTVWMAEVAEESTHVPSHKARIALFLSAMRHHRDEMRAAGRSVDYQELPPEPGGDDEAPSLAAALDKSIRRLRPERLAVVLPGEWRVLEALRGVAGSHGLELAVLEDRGFYTTPEDFARHAEGRKEVRLEYFYREQRKRFGVLMDGREPVGGRWNFDQENRGSFGKQGPGATPPPASFRPDATTRAVLALVERRFADNPGELAAFDWPVTHRDALRALDDFVRHRLARFGDYQDAMWTGHPWLHHARLSAAMNLRLLAAREVVDAAVAAFDRGAAPIESVEGFVRQVLGWREYVRGVYWNHMPAYAERNALGARGALPDFYWTGDTEMACLREAIGQTLELGYAHHIQRLMVTGLFAMLLGVDPKRVHHWYLSVYVDAVEWVELPNTLGMSQYADGGLMASKPYAATGKYIHRMSNYCAGCRFHPDHATGERACPFTTLYWDFLRRHRPLLEKNQRMALQVKNLDRKDSAELDQIAALAERLRAELSPCGAS